MSAFPILCGSAPDDGKSHCKNETMCNLSPYLHFDGKGVPINRQLPIYRHHRTRIRSGAGTHRADVNDLLVALHLTVVKLTCNENGDPDILLLARFHTQPGGA